MGVATPRIERGKNERLGEEEEGEREYGRVRAVSLLRNRHDADVSRYIPGSTTTALLSSNPEVPSPARGGCMRSGTEGRKTHSRREGENEGGENRGCRASGAMATATVVGQRRLQQTAREGR